MNISTGEIEILRLYLVSKLADLVGLQNRPISSVVQEVRQSHTARVYGRDKRVVRESRTLRAMWRGLETDLRCG